MKRFQPLLPVLLAGSLLAAAAPARSQQINIGIGSVLGNSGVSTGIGYRFGRWRDRLGIGFNLDARQLLGRKKGKHKDRKRESRAAENLLLDVSPGNAHVFLDGMHVDAHGRDALPLPPGRHRLEFVRPGYRTEVAEVDVQPGIDFRIRRKLAKLPKGEPGDPRAENPGPALSVEQAVQALKLKQEPPRPVVEPAKVTPAAAK